MAADGILVVDKPRGKTSRAMTTAVSRLFQEKRAGHLGTLDPLATGVLPVMLGKATRLARFLEGQAKEYRATIRLGQETDTWDAAGKVIAEFSLGDLSAAQVRRAAVAFQGQIEQVPPMFSALKVEGQPLYRLARKGMEFPRKPRQVRIEELEVEAVNLPELILRVVCSPGTYLRSLAHDLGQKLGVGGHLLALRRFRSGGFTLAQATPGDPLELEKAQLALIPLRECLPDFPLVTISPEDERRLCRGQPIFFTGLGIEAGRYVRLVREDLVAVARAEANGDKLLLQPRRVLADPGVALGRKAEAC